MRYLINFFQKKGIFLHVDYCSNFKRRYSTYIFIRLTHHKKKGPQFNFSRQKVEKVCFHEKNNVFLQTSRLKTY